MKVEMQRWKWGEEFQGKFW